MKEPNDAFVVGDFIEVTPGPHVEDFGTIRGTALDSRGLTGPAYFNVQVPTGHDEATTLRFSLNEVTVKRLFRASVARRLLAD